MIGEATSAISEHPDPLFVGFRAPGDAPPSSPMAPVPDMQAAIDSILRDESLAFEERLCRWRMHGDPRNDIEEVLLQETVHLWSQLDRVKKAYIEQVRTHIESAQDDERELVHELGKRLFFDRLGPTPLHGIRPAPSSKLTTSWNGKAVDPDDPAVLVRKLESTGTGCRWLVQQWSCLRERLEPEKWWQSHDRFKIIRLLGHQPIDAAEDRCIAEIYAASCLLEPGAVHAFVDLLSDMATPELENYTQRDTCAIYRPGRHHHDQRSQTDPDRPGRSEHRTIKCENRNVRRGHRAHCRAHGGPPQLRSQRRRDSACADLSCNAEPSITAGSNCIESSGARKQPARALDQGA